jgi:hypothetical protein
MAHPQYTRVPPHSVRALQGTKDDHVYRECPLEVKTLFVQTIIKPEHYSESLSLPASVSVMIIEAQWDYSLLSQILGLENDKFVV